MRLCGVPVSAKLWPCPRTMWRNPEFFLEFRNRNLPHFVNETVQKIIETRQKKIETKRKIIETLFHFIETEMNENLTHFLMETGVILLIGLISGLHFIQPTTVSMRCTREHSVAERRSDTVKWSFVPAQR